MRPEIRVKPADHISQPWRVHSLLSDFELEDVWRVPVTLTSAQSLRMFVDQVSGTTSEVGTKGLAGLLFRIRLFVGKLLKWDKECVTDHLVPGTIRHRYAQQEKLRYEDLPDPGSRSFIPVYELENEALAEIENSTVHGALHLSRLLSGPGAWAIHIAVYVKPKGLLGRLYMVLIKPFRLWIVYPAMMDAARKRWEQTTGVNA